MLGTENRTCWVQEGLGPEKQNFCRPPRGIEKQHRIFINFGSTFWEGRWQCGASSGSQNLRFRFLRRVLQRILHALLPLSGGRRIDHAARCTGAGHFDVDPSGKTLKVHEEINEINL